MVVRDRRKHWNRQPLQAAVTLVTAAVLLLSACQSPAGARPAGPEPVQTSTVPSFVKPTQETETPEPTATAMPRPTDTPDVTRVWLPPYLPEALSQSLAFPEGVEPVESETEANLWVKTPAQGEEGPLLAEWLYVLVAPFPTIPDDAALVDVRGAWQGMPERELPFDALMVDEATRAAFERSWGPAAPFVKTVPTRQLIERAWAEKTWWALVPFETLDPRWKVIALNGQSPVRKGFDPAAYDLKLRFVIEGEPERAQSVAPEQAYLNYDAGKLTTVMLTGVTALVRGTGALMEIHGMDYPAEFIGDELREADILHINNEVPFWKTCPEPYEWEGLVFCSRTKYIQLLEDIGTDVIDLAGDHFQDWGPEAMLFTIELYRERGWPYYGGGANIQEAQSAARFEHNGNKIAFLGCNAKAPGYAVASETRAGAVHCDFDQLTAEIARQRRAGYLPIVTFQHLEYYSYNAHPILVEDFNRVAEAGAVVVSGSQAHQPHAMAFTSLKGEDPSFMHYGLGNLFFDQLMFGIETSQGFLDRHIFYNGRYISTELVTIIFVDNARARIMTPEERQNLLTIIFGASGWAQTDQ